jgi:hypothetical protein
MRLALCLVLTATLLPALAEAAPAKVYYRFGADKRLAEAEEPLRMALDGPDFQVEKAASPEVLVIGMDGPPEHLNQKKRFQFTIVFSRNGDRIGESAEECTVGKLGDCVKQIASDVKSAAGM